MLPGDPAENTGFPSFSTSVLPMMQRAFAPLISTVSIGLCNAPKVAWLPTIGMPPTTCPGMPEPCSVSMNWHQLPSASTTAISQLPLGCLSSCLTRSEEHTSELQSLMRISYAVFCLKQKTTHKHIHT